MFTGDNISWDGIKNENIPIKDPQDLKKTSMGKKKKILSSH